MNDLAHRFQNDLKNPRNRNSPELLAYRGFNKDSLLLSILETLI